MNIHGSGKVEFRSSEVDDAKILRPFRPPDRVKDPVPHNQGRHIRYVTSVTCPSPTCPIRLKSMELKPKRIISIITLVASLAGLFLVLKKPTPVAQHQAPAAIAENAKSFDQKMNEFQQSIQQSPST